MLTRAIFCVFLVISVSRGETEVDKPSIISSLGTFIYKSAFDSDNLDGWKIGPMPLNQTISFNQDGLVVNASLIGNFSVDSITPTFEAEDKNGHTVVDLDISGLKFDGSYSLDGLVKLVLPLSGEGDLSVNWSYLNLTIRTSITPIGGVLLLEYFNLHYDQNGLNVSIDGIGSHKDLATVLKYFIMDVVPEILDHYHLQIENGITTLVRSQSDYDKIDLNTMLKLLKLVL